MNVDLVEFVIRTLDVPMRVYAFKVLLTVSMDHGIPESQDRAIQQTWQVTLRRNTWFGYSSDF